MANTRTVVCAVLVVLGAAACATAKGQDCKPLDKYFSPTGSFTVFKAMMERLTKLTGEMVYGLGDEQPDPITLFVPSDAVIVDLLQDIGISINDWLTMDQTELGKITQVHATMGNQKLKKGDRFMSFNPKVHISVLDNDDDAATIYTGLTTAQVNLTMPMYDICNVVWYAISEPLLPANDFVFNFAGR